MKMVVKGNWKKKYELLKKDHERLLKEAITAGNVIAFLKSKVVKYETILEADEKSKETTIIQQENTLNKYKQLIEVKDQLIKERDEKNQKIIDKFVHTYGLEKVEELLEGIV